MKTKTTARTNTQYHGNLHKTFTTIRQGETNTVTPVLSGYVSAGTGLMKNQIKPSLSPK